MYHPSFTSTAYNSDIGDEQLEADLHRWDWQQSQCTHQLEEHIQQEERIKKLFQDEMLSAVDVTAKATFAPAYRDIKKDAMVYQTYAEVFQGELNYADMHALLTQLVIEQVKAGNALAQEIFVRASLTFAASNSSDS
ncbi:MAG: hypothetical protein ACRCWR_01920 [Saezia sp.]